MNKIDILIPIAGKSSFFDKKNSKFPKPLIEINSKPMIQLVLENFSKLDIIDKFIFVVNNDDCKKFYLDNILKLLTEDKCYIIKLDSGTKGAACSCLMAIDKINKDKELVICNGDQVLDVDYIDVINSFRKEKSDFGVITFDSVHPRWSYIRFDESKKIIEASEKRPISKTAIAGFYYFKKANYFIESAMKMIEKSASINGLYYIAPSINELILENKNSGSYHINSTQYHSFYSPKKIKDFER